MTTIVRVSHFGRLVSLCVRLVAPLVLGAGAALGASAQNQLGVVVLHGKQGSPTGEVVEPVISAMRSAGFLVDAPEMPWSGRRIYDATFTQALAEIDQAVDRLRKAGAATVVVAGMSMGGSAVFAYGATRKVDGACPEFCV